MATLANHACRKLADLYRARYASEHLRVNLLSKRASRQKKPRRTITNTTWKRMDLHHHRRDVLNLFVFLIKSRTAIVRVFTAHPLQTIRPLQCVSARWLRHPRTPPNWDTRERRARFAPPPSAADPPTVPPGFRMTMEKFVGKKCTQKKLNRYQNGKNYRDVEYR